MKLIKYKTNTDDYALVHKTGAFVYYLIFKNNQYHYFESYLKNFNKTKRISEKMLQKKIIDLEVIEYNDYDLTAKADNFLSQKVNDYHLISETFGDNQYSTFTVLDKNLNRIIDLKGQRHSPTFISSYILHKFNFNLSLEFHSFGEVFLKQIDKKDELKIKKYTGLMFYKYKKYQFEDIKINFDLFWFSMDERYLMKTFFHYDKVIKIDTEKIINHFSLQDKEKKISYVYYAASYFATLFFIDFIKSNKIKNCKISINSCLFKVNFCKNFMDDKSNEYFFSSLNNLKNGLIFFTEEKLNDKIVLIKNKYFKNKTNEVKKIII